MGTFGGQRCGRVTVLKYELRYKLRKCGLEWLNLGFIVWMSYNELVVA